MFHQFQKIFPPSLYFCKVRPQKPWRWHEYFCVPLWPHFGSCNNHSGPYHHSLSFCYLLNPTADIPHAVVSAVLCFVLRYGNATSVSLMISLIWFLAKTDAFSLFLIHYDIYSAFSNLTALATKCRLLAPISTDINSSLGMVSFFLCALLALEKMKLTEFFFFLCVGRWQLHMLCLTNYRNTVADWIHFP